jgi:hypothetical protein
LRTAAGPSRRLQKGQERKTAKRTREKTAKGPTRTAQRFDRASAQARRPRVCPSTGKPSKGPLSPEFSGSWSTLDGARPAAKSPRGAARAGWKTRPRRRPTPNMRRLSGFSSEFREHPIGISRGSRDSSRVLPVDDCKPSATFGCTPACPWPSRAAPTRRRAPLKASEGASEEESTRKPGMHKTRLDHVLVHLPLRGRQRAADDLHGGGRRGPNEV